MELTRRSAIAVGIAGMTMPDMRWRDPATLDSPDWPAWRGPDATGIVDTKGLPTRWAENQNVLWKTPILGRGHSTPVILDGQVWFTSATPDGKEQSVYCLSLADGKVLFTQKLFDNANPEPIADLNSYASPSAAIERGRVYVHFGTYGTACFDTKSFKPVWVRRDINCTHSVGPGSTPLLWKSLLILTMDGIDVQYMIALDKATGQTKWKSPRSADFSTVRVESRKSYGTPVLFNREGKPTLFCNSAKAAYLVDPATGRELWRVRHDGYSNSSVAAINDGVVYFSTGYDRADLLACKLSGEGDVTESNILWKYSKNVPFKPASMLLDGLLYLLGDSGFLTCLDAKTGEEIYKERIGGSFSSSPLAAEGKLYLSDEQGRTYLVRTGRKFEILGENLLGDGIMASLAVSGKTLVLRTKSAVYRIG